MILQIPWTLVANEPAMIRTDCCSESCAVVAAKGMSEVRGKRARQSIELNNVKMAERVGFEHNDVTLTSVF